MGKTGNWKLEIRNSVREQVTGTRNPERRIPNPGQDLGKGISNSRPEKMHHEDTKTPRQTGEPKKMHHQDTKTPRQTGEPKKMHHQDTKTPRQTGSGKPSVFVFPVSGMVLSWCLGVLVVRFVEVVLPKTRRVRN